MFRGLVDGRHDEKSHGFLKKKTFKLRING